MTFAPSAVEACPACGARPRSALACEACGALLEPPASASPFTLLGFEPAYALDAAALRRRFTTLSRALHPDFHSGADAPTRRRAEDNTAALNAAYQRLSDDARRADWLVQALGGPREEDERAMPAAFLEEVLEWNELIDAARAARAGAPERTRLGSLTDELSAARDAALRRVAAALTPLPLAGAPSLRAVRRELNGLRYLERALRELGELALAAG
jgi:DnaJ-domain-containing protein 1